MEIVSLIGVFKVKSELSSQPFVLYATNLQHQKPSGVFINTMTQYCCFECISTMSTYCVFVPCKTPFFLTAVAVTTGLSAHCEQTDTYNTWLKLGENDGLD